MNPTALLLRLALPLSVLGCGAPTPSPRTLVDLVSDECVVLRKGTEDSRVHDVCATADALEPIIARLLSAKRAAVARAGNTAHPAPSGATSGAP